MAKKLLRFENCRILKNGKILENDYLLVRDGKIINYMDVFFDEERSPDIRIDCKGALLSPGLIDIQVNGGFGVDFANNIENIEEGLKIVSEGLLQHGVTGFCPTLVSSSPDVYRKVLPKIGPTSGAINLGCHVEGPFVNKKRVGAHAVENLRTFENGIKTAEEVYGDLSNIKIITLAPEIDGALETIKQLKERGIIISIGHSEANLSTAEAAFKNGASLITHLFNAMVPFHHRDPGILGLLTSVPIYFGLINDGCHTHPAAVKIAYRAHYDGLILVTDAISALGLREGIHRIGKLEMEIKNNCAYILGTNTLCGSMLPLNGCVRLLNEFTQCGKIKAIEAATLHPAQMLGIADRKGTLNDGADADITLFDDDFNVMSTWIAGRCVYSKTADSFEIIENQS